MRAGVSSSNRLLVQMYCLMVALAFGLAVAILAGGEARFSTPSFSRARTLVEWVPGIESWFAWGLMFLLLGVALLIGIGQEVAVHLLRFGLVVYVFFVITFIGSALNESLASFVGVIVFVVFAGIHLLLSQHLDRHGWN